MANKIPTAEEFFEQGGTYPELAIAFAKLHVKAALEAVKNNMNGLERQTADVDEYGMGYLHSDYNMLRVDDVYESILSAYPGQNIK